MTRRNDALVGVVLLLAVLVLVFGTIWMQGMRLGQEERELQARFREVGQLQEGAAVKFRGVPIGRVERVELEQGGTGVIVTMSVDSEVTLPGEPAVVLAPGSMFGDWQAEVVSRRALPYEYTEGRGTVLPGFSLPDMSRLTAVASEIANNLATISNRVELAFTEETALNVREAIENIQRASSELATLVSSQQEAIEEVARNLESTSEAAGQAAATLQRAFAEVESAIGGGKLTNIMTNVENASFRADSLLAVLADASRDLQRTARSADSTFRSVGGIAASVEQGEGSLGMLLRDTVLYRSLVETNIELQTLLQDLRENPRRYINLRIF